MAELISTWRAKWQNRLAKPAETLKFLDTLSNQQLENLIKAMIEAYVRNMPTWFGESLGLLNSVYLLRTSGQTLIKKSLLQRLLRK
jgi:hypothetical protein